MLCDVAIMKDIEGRSDIQLVNFSYTVNTYILWDKIYAGTLERLLRPINGTNYIRNIYNFFILLSTGRPT